MTIRFGIVGSGYMGRTYAFGLANINRGGAFVAVTGGSRAPRLAADFGASVEPTIEALLSRSDVDALIVATPHSTHLPYTLAAARARKHVFVEKPMALNVAECNAMVAACRDANVLLGVNKITRHRGAGMNTNKAIDEGRIGAVRMIRGTSLIAGCDAPDKRWLMDPAEGSPWLDYGAHGCDIVRWLSGSEAAIAFGRFASYTADAPAGQTGMIEFEMSNGVLAQLWMSYEIPNGAVSELGRYLVIGSEGVIDFNAYGTVTLYRDGASEVLWETPPFQYIADPFTVNRVTGFANQLQDFIEAIRDGRPPAVTGEDGRAAIEMVEAAERSAATGQAVRLPLAG